MSIIQRLTPQDAYKAMTATSDALLIDVRDPVEYVFVGHPIHSKNIPWAFAPDMRKNSSFVEQVQETHSSCFFHAQRGEHLADSNCSGMAAGDAHRIIRQIHIEFSLHHCRYVVAGRIFYCIRRLTSAEFY
ncbi:MAG: hypothetical protein EB012_08490 [Gammaproteobacteria bacterium]|nr:hypothetical protein [Gammaproteobacteria bacterium]